MVTLLLISIYSVFGFTSLTDSLGNADTSKINHTVSDSLLKSTTLDSSALVKADTSNEVHTLSDSLLKSTTPDSSALVKADTSNEVHTLSDSLLTITAYDSGGKADTLVLNTIKPPLQYPKYENNAFHIGEKLTFKVRYGFVRAGTATMSVVKETIMNDKQVYHIQTTAESDAPFSWVYNVEDVVNSFIDKDGLFTWRFEKKLREGGYKVDLLVDYFPEDSLAKVDYTRYRDEGTENNQYDVKVPPFALDVLAAFYYVRTKPLRVGDIIQMVNHDNKKVYNLEVHVYMRETIDTSAGTFKCLRIEPLLKGEGLFQQKGRLLVWLTDDEYKIPVQMTSEVAVGHITTELEEIEGIKQKLPSMVSE
jgi:hypothetical protein